MNLLFDLDGTLTDPVVGITRCIQHALSGLGSEAPPSRELERFVGPPLRETFAELLSTNDVNLVGRAVALYRERFASVGMFENAIYPDVAESLVELAHHGHRMWVVTSKPRVYARRIVDHFGLGTHFARVYGSELDGRNCDKRDLIRQVLTDEKIGADETWMIGDRAQDIRGGRANEVGTVGVLWGYGSEDELRAESPDLLVGGMSALLDALRCICERLAENRHVVPDWVPQRVAAGLDVSELAPASDSVLVERRALESALGVYVAAYRAGAKGKARGLCILYETADLSAEALARIQAAEQRHRGVVFVAYRRPLQACT